ncbi:MAG: ADP-ribose pyrophosphatase [Parvicella sp.]|jgi:ADP-ribose pyrophosphatase
MNKLEERVSSWQTLHSEVKYETPWIKVTHNDVITPAHTSGIYGCVHFKNIAVGILPLDANMHTYIVQQYRYPLEKFTWEIPEGGSPLDALPLDTAKKELLEEVGLKATSWQLIQELELSDSATDEYAYIYIARDLSQFESALEDTEDIIVKKIHFDTFFEMVENGEIKDAISVAAAYKVKLMILNNEIL